MDCKLEDCRNYFSSHPAFHSSLKLMQKKWQSLGRVAGTVTLPDASLEERQALSSLLGKQFQKGTVRFSLPEFEEALQRTKFAGISLHSLLEVYFGQPLVTVQDQRAAEKLEKEKFWDTAQLPFSDDSQSTPYLWIAHMRRTKEAGYLIVAKEYAEHRDRAQALLNAVGMCLKEVDNLFYANEAWTYLAVLAANVTGNPHYLDRGTQAGNLFLWGLAFRSGCPFPESAKSVLELYDLNGVQPDDISNSVAAYGIHLRSTSGLHPAFEGFLAEHQPGIVTLGNLSNIQQAYGQSKTVFVVENEMVFSHLVNQLKGMPISLVCTSGQPKAAAYVLLDLLEQDVRIYYAGDLDPEGLCIADRLWRKYPEKLTIWRMDKEDYLCALSEESMSATRIAKMENLSNPTLQRTAQSIREKRLAGYQENLLKEMETDIRQICMFGIMDQ